MTQISILRQLAIFMFTCVMMTVITSALYYWQQRKANHESSQLTQTALTQLARAHGLTESVSNSQRMIQNVLREKDPDEIEKTLANVEKYRKTARTIIADMGVEGNSLTAKYDALVGEQKKVVDTFLLGNGSLAYDQFNGACSVKFDEVTDEISKYYHSVQAQTEQQMLATQKKHSAAIVGQMAAVSVILAILLAAGWRLKTYIAVKLQAVCRLLINASIELDENASKVSNASRLVAEGASTQAASLEETSASMEEMTEMTKRNAENAEQAKSMAQEGRTSAEKAAGDIHQLSEAVKTIGDSSQHLRQAMDKIGASSMAISQIMKTIDEIAFQTNILSLNAAVEAARAGESGAGFAVVADEVRNLAKRSADAARETARMIKESSDSSEQGTRVTEQVATDLENINQIANQVTTSLNSIVDQVRRMDHVIEEISTACRDQSQGIGQVTASLNDMDKVTQANAAGAEESASATEELRTQAGDIKDVASQLRVLVEGKKGTASMAKDSNPAPTDSLLSAGVPGARPRFERTVQPMSRS